MILQNVRDFVVQIRHPVSGVIRGTGFVISDGFIVTCSHVVREILGTHPRSAYGQIVNIYFPQVSLDAESSCEAQVEWAPETDDDIVLLRLVNKLPISSDQVAIIGTAEQSMRHTFRGYGYAPTGNTYISTYVEGEIADVTLFRFSSDDPNKFPHLRLLADSVRKGVSGSPVLDTERNLVVGMIRGRSRENGQQYGWAVDLKVLQSAPVPIPFVSDYTFYTDQLLSFSQLESDRRPRLFPGWRIATAPSAIDAWVGRIRLLETLTRDYLRHRKAVLAIVGFGGEGKSSIARRWLDEIKDRSSERPSLEYADSIPHPNLPSVINAPDGVFWWSFYTDRNVDAFLEAALQFVSKDTVDSRQFINPLSKIAEIMRYVCSGQFLFVLDGLEVFQYVTGNQQGMIDSYDLARFLEDFAYFEHLSFCLITSRLPVLNLIKYRMYGQYNLQGLALEDGVKLLETLKVKGLSADMEAIVSEWDGHALTLTMISTYLKRFHEGDAKLGFQFKPFAVADNDPYERLRHILKQYDARLSSAERTILIVMSCFRTLIPANAMQLIFRKPNNQLPLVNDISVLSDIQFNGLIESLTTGQLMRLEASSTYDIHALIREFYQEQFANWEHENQNTLHRQISDYLTMSNTFSDSVSSLQYLLPLIEAVYHSCAGSDLATAFTVMWEHVSQRERYLIGLELGALSTALNMLENFFNERDFRKGIRLDPEQGSFLVLNAFGYCLMATGRLIDARDFFDQLLKTVPELGQESVSVLVYRNLAEVYGYLGELRLSRVAIEHLDTTAKRIDDLLLEKFQITDDKKVVNQLNEVRHHRMQAKTWFAWNAFLLGALEDARKYYMEAVTLARSLSEGYAYPPYRGAIGYADFLMMTEQYDEAYTVIQFAFEMARSNHRSGTEALCHRALGDWYMSNSNLTQAELNYNRAVQLATNFGAVQYLIETLIARAKYSINAKHYREAGADLKRAIDFSREGSYRLYEADAYNWTSRMYLAMELPERALDASEYALNLSNRSAYLSGSETARQNMVSAHNLLK
jgi:tetratricopeptide (TPR) repeat protein